MRITIRPDEQLPEEAKKRAAEKETTLTALIEDSLREALTRRTPPDNRHRFRMTTFGKRGMQAEVDLDDTSSLLGAKGNLITDAYLAALAIESGSKWITADRDFSRFPALRWRHPLG